MPRIGTSIASKLIAEIRNIRRFPSADKLARFAGTKLQKGKPLVAWAVLFDGSEHGFSRAGIRRRVMGGHPLDKSLG